MNQYVVWDTDDRGEKPWVNRLEKNHGLIVWVYNCFLATVENLVTLIQRCNVSYSVVQCYQITMGGLLHTMLQKTIAKVEICQFLESTVSPLRP